MPITTSPDAAPVIEATVQKAGAPARAARRRGSRGRRATGGRADPSAVQCGRGEMIQVSEIERLREIAEGPAPDASAATALSGLAVIITTGIVGSISLTAFRTSTPLMPGMAKSRNTRSGRLARTEASALVPSRANATS